MDSSRQPFTFSLKEEPIENHRRLEIRVIGAGFSGIYLGIRVPQRLRNVNLKIYEKNERIGGTWWVNRYPGCACDVPSHSYQYSFVPNPDWSSFYAPQAEIQSYLQNVADRYGVMRFVSLGHEVQSCTWSADTMKWHLKICNLENGHVSDDEADVLISARGNLSLPTWPKIPGLETFGGELMHSASWNANFDFKGKSIGVIGNGSSAIQIVPKLQKTEGSKLSCFVRSATWITNPFGEILFQNNIFPRTRSNQKLTHKDIIHKLSLDPQDPKFSNHQREELANSPEKLHALRKAIEQDGNTVHAICMKNHELHRSIAESTRAAMRSRLSSKPDIAEFLIPGFAVGCKRMTPGLGYLEALTASNVDFFTDRITKVTRRGVILESGRQVNLDCLVCATGFNTSGVPPFSIHGLNGISLAERFHPHPEAYLSLAVDGFPNFFIMAGPNSAVGSGSFTMILEAQGDYIVKCMRKVQKEDYAYMEIKKQQVIDWSEYCQSYFRTTVYTDDCESWYKSKGANGQQITGLWPGSTLHALEALRAPRWEDYNWENVPGVGNNMRWLGNGWSVTHLKCNDQGDYGGDPSWYLEPEFQHVPLPGKPEEDPAFKKRPFSH